MSDRFEVYIQLKINYDSLKRLSDTDSLFFFLFSKKNDRVNYLNPWFVKSGILL